MDYNLVELSKEINSFGIIEYLTDFYGIEFKKYGNNLRTECPFPDHNDTDPSFTVTVGKNVWYCFGCKSGGSLISFVQKMEDCSRMDAISTLCDNLDIDKSEFVTNTEIKQSYSILEDALSFFKECAKTSNTMEKFFDSKGSGFYKYVITQDVGYCPHVDDLVKFLKEKGYEDNDIWSHKLNSDNYTNAITYPIYNKYGFVAYFSCRLFGEVKYMSGSSQLPSFVPDLMGGIKTLKSNLPTFIVEGENDRLALNKYKFNAVSMTGTKFNENMINILKVYEISDLYFWVDGDQAGWELLEKLAEDYGQLFCKHNINGYAIYVEGVDPDKACLNKMNVEKLVEDALLIPAFDVTKITQAHKIISYSTKKFKDYNAFTSEYMIDYLNRITGWNKDSIMDIVYENMDYDTHIEKQVLSCIGQDPSIIARFGLEEGMFRLKSCQKLFRIKEQSSNETIDEWLSKFIDRLPVPNMSLLGEYVSSLKNLYIDGEIENIAKSVLRSRKPAEDKIDYINEKIVKLNQGNTEPDNVGSVTKGIIDRIINKKVVSGYDLGKNWTRMNNALLGLCRKRLLLISGNTGHGKTNLALNIAHELSFVQTYKGLIISGEMDSDEIVTRMMSISTGVESTDIMTGNVSDRDMEKIFEMSAKLNSDAFRIDTDVNISNIVNLTTYMVHKYGIDYLIVDYMQLLEPSPYMRNLGRPQQLKEMTRILKTKICQALNIPVIALAQLSDSGLDDPTPQGRRMSESKLMQADADVVMAMRKKTSKEMELDPIGNTILHIDKVRYNRSNLVLPINFYETSMLMKEA